MIFMLACIFFLACLIFKKRERRDRHNHQLQQFQFQRKVQQSHSTSSFDKSLSKTTRDSSTSHQKSKRRNSETNVGTNSEINEARELNSPTNLDSSGEKMLSPRVGNCLSSVCSPSTGMGQNSLTNQVTPSLKTLKSPIVPLNNKPSPVLPCEKRTIQERAPSPVLPCEKRTIQERAPWTEVFDILQEDYGFSRVPGSGLVPEYFVTAAFRGVHKKYLQSNLKEGEDYFNGEEGLKAYAHERYNWVGEPGREFRPLKSRRQNYKDYSNSVKVSSLPSCIQRATPWTEVKSRSKKRRYTEGSDESQKRSVAKKVKIKRGTGASTPGKGKLPESKKSKKEAWDEKLWDERFAQLVEYRRAHGHCNVPDKYPVLGRWVQRQRQKYHGREYPVWDSTNLGKELTEEQIAKLENLDFQWRLRRRRKRYN